MFRQRPTEEDAEYARMRERYEEEWELLSEPTKCESVIMLSRVWPSHKCHICEHVNTTCMVQELTTCVVCSYCPICQ
jgi:hypothetical protein